MGWRRLEPTRANEKCEKWNGDSNNVGIHEHNSYIDSHKIPKRNKLY